MKRKLFMIAILAIVGLSGFLYLKYNRQELLSDEITLYGNVDIRDVVLGFRQAGRIKELKVDEGDQVKAGDVLAILDKDTFKQALDLNKALLEVANANFDNAKKEFIRQQKLNTQKINAQKDFDSALQTYNAALANQDAAKANLDLAQIALGDTELKAPESGTILTRVREMGSIVAAGAPIFTLSLDKPVWIRTYIDEPHLSKVKPGQKVKILTDSEETFEGQVGFVSPQAEFTPKTVETTELRTSLVYRLRIIVTNANGSLRQGMPVTIQLLKDVK